VHKKSEQVLVWVRKTSLGRKQKQKSKHGLTYSETAEG